MTTAVQRRRGTNTEHASFTGLEGELSVNTTNESVHVHDGSTAGGFELMRADGSNSSVSLGDITGVTAGTGLSGGGTSGDVTLNIDSTVATLAGTQTFTNKTLTSPILNTPTIGTSFTIGGATITEAELEILDGATLSTTELNYVDGVTSSIQTQIDAKAPIASPTFTGTVTIPTADINAGSIDGTAIGASSASTGAFTTLTATGAFTSVGIDDNADATAITIDSSENVGIGTTSPSRTFHSKGASGISTTGKFEAGGSQVYIQLSSTGQADGDSGYIGYDSSENLTLFTGNTERMRIDSSGNVGIGTSTTVRKLTVNETGTSAIAHFESDQSASKVYFHDANTSQTYSVALGSIGDDMVFYASSGGSERMRIDSSGNLLVGTTATTPTTGGIVLYKDSTRGIVRAGTNITAADAVAAWYNPNGKVGQIVTSGSSTSYNTTSDSRLKENIADADDAGSKIDAIQVRQYDWKADGSHQDYGMIAQELVEVAPEAVTVPADSEDMMGVDYSKLVPMLIKEIQSLRNRVAQLEE